MNWGSIFNRTSVSTAEAPVIPGTTPLQQQRLKQIESLRSFNQNVKEEEWDKEYSIEFNAGGPSFKLFIVLPTQFPHEKPSVRITPGGSHPWLDERMYVTGCSALNNFYMHSSLGKVIRQLIEDFKANPPQTNPVSSFGDVMYQNYNTITSSTPTAILISTASVEEETKTKKRKNPDECTTIYELMDALGALSFEELEKLSEDTGQLLKYAMNMDSIKVCQEKRKTIIESNREQAGITHFDEM